MEGHEPNEWVIPDAFGETEPEVSGTAVNRHVSGATRFAVALVAALLVGVGAGALLHHNQAPATAVPGTGSSGPAGQPLDGGGGDGFSPRRGGPPPDGRFGPDDAGPDSDGVVSQ